jgi:hypothetical protein
MPPASGGLRLFLNYDPGLTAAYPMAALRVSDYTSFFFETISGLSWAGAQKTLLPKEREVKPMTVDFCPMTVDR